MKTILLLVIAALIIYIVLPKKKKEKVPPLPVSPPYRPEPVEHRSYATTAEDDDYNKEPVVRSPRRNKAPKRKPQGAAANPNFDISQDEIIKFNMNKIPSKYLKPKKDVVDTGSFFYRKKVCISGEMNSFPVRPELAEILWDLGADIDTGVGKFCEILICGSGAGPSKCRTAEAQGVHIMDEAELIEKLDGIKSKYV